MPTVILRSLLGRVGTVLVGLAGLWLTAVVWLADGWGHGLQVLAAAAAAVLLVWLLWWRPEARLDLDGVRVRNAWRSHVVAWESLRSITTRWGLVLEAEGGAGTLRIPVSACPRGGLFTAMRHERRAPQAHDRLIEMRLEESGPVRVERAHLDCDDAGYLLDLYRLNRDEYLSVSRRLRRRQERLARSGRSGPADRASATVGTAGAVSRWDAAPLAATAAGAVGLILAAALL